jgi:hypothetical protein
MQNIIRTSDKTAFSIVPEISTGWMSFFAAGVLILFHHRTGLIGAWRQRWAKRRATHARTKRRRALLASRFPPGS